MKSIPQLIGSFVCLLVITAFLLFGSFVQPAFAFYCPDDAYCTSRCDEFSKVMEERTPFYYEGEVAESCVATLSEAGIRVREEGNSLVSVLILTTGKPFPFRSEWVGRKSRGPDTWYFEQYKA